MKLQPYAGRPPLRPMTSPRHEACGHPSGVQGRQGHPLPQRPRRLVSAVDRPAVAPGPTSGMSTAVTANAGHMIGTPARAGRGCVSVSSDQSSSGVTERDLDRRRVLYLIVCAAAPASQAGALVELAQAAQWDVWAIATHDATAFI